MKTDDARSDSYVGVAFVTLAAAAAIIVMWLVGGPYHSIMMDFGRDAPLPTQLAIRSRRELTIGVLTALLLAIAVHRHRNAVMFLIILGCLELTIAGAYGIALWLTLRSMSPPMQT